MSNDSFHTGMSLARAADRNIDRQIESLTTDRDHWRKLAERLAAAAREMDSDDSGANRELAAALADFDRAVKGDAIA